VRTILLLMVNPKGTQQLRLDEEVRRIGRVFRTAQNRDMFQLVVRWAVTDDDLRQALLENQPEIIHFGGHGLGSGGGTHGRDLGSAGEDEGAGLIFEDDQGHPRLISGEALARLFALYSDQVKCVLMNACYSKSQADAVVQHIDYVIAMKQAISDAAALKFAVGFYEAITTRNYSYDFAFRHGCSAIDLNGIPEHLTPVILKRAGLCESPQSLPPPVLPAIPPNPLVSSVSNQSVGTGKVTATPDASNRSAPIRKAFTQGPAVHWDREVLRTASRNLAWFTGPFAQEYVRQAAEKARDVHHLYKMLARVIPSEEERKQFLASEPD
jgi:hypothetical protein